ncbi:MAG TPA: hypothetical protein VJX92_02455 [Methylomirabilota bacterium]|nr:hypothetical protein [Methylomirabilota bacterium]
MTPPPTVLDPAMVQIGLLAAAVIIVVVIVALVIRSRRRLLQTTGEHPPDIAGGGHDMAHWIDEGRRLFNVWQERIEQLDELRIRLAAMTEEIERLRVEVARIDDLRADLDRLGREADRLRAERTAMQEALARIGEVAQGAIARSSASGGE